ncbi:MAG: phytanoyl-CoA dioxygenase family protein, partial [Planctomycetota bacterium]
MKSLLPSTIDTPLTLPRDQVDAFQRQGFVHLRDVFPREEIESWRTAVSEAVRANNTEDRPLSERDTYGQAFLQTMNLWETCPEIRPLVFSKRLAGIARDLLGVEGVRLYHDQALFKEAGGGHTPWHADQFYWPLESHRTVTAWIP